MFFGGRRYLRRAVLDNHQFNWLASPSAKPQILNQSVCGESLSFGTMTGGIAGPMEPPGPQFVGAHHTAARSSLSTPRTTILSASPGNGRRNGLGFIPRRAHPQVPAPAPWEPLQRPRRRLDQDQRRRSTAAKSGAWHQDDFSPSNLPRLRSSFSAWPYSRTSGSPFGQNYEDRGAPRPPPTVW